MTTAAAATDTLRQYTLRFDDGTSETIQALDDADANQQAIDMVTDAWDGSGRTTWTDVVVIDDTGDYETLTVQVDPPAPMCSHEGGHDWQSPLEVVGGCESNPGVQGKGGGVVIKEVCAHCGNYRITDTWAQRPDNCEEGHRTVSYRKPDACSRAWLEGDD